MKKRFSGVAVFLIAGVLRASTNVFEMAAIYPKHMQLQQQMIQAVRAGKIEEMESVCRAGVELMPDDPTWRYNLACALAYRANKDEALAALDRAIELGFRDAAAIAADSDLKQMARLPKFQELVAKAKRLAGQPAEGVVQVKPTVAFMGLPVEMNASNTYWDFDQGCFRTLFSLNNADGKRVSAYAEAYQGPAAESVRGWFTNETASGNFGDLYVNHDGGHSKLAVGHFPGLTPVTYCAEAQACRVHLSFPNTLFNQPVIANASLSMVSGPFWRCLPRAIVTDPYLPMSAFRFYINNQCWFYPAHKDFDTQNGDLIPANTPYYVVSQGSSFTDQPFMEAFAASMAAFRPETKRQLVARNVLAPTLQMLFRSTQKTVQKPEDYFSSAAHPVVFQKANLNAEAMVGRAHEMKPDEIPPVVLLRTVSDARAVPGVDYFDLRPEGLFDTPFAIARVVRGMARERRMTLEASVPGGTDTLRFRWALLQGDPAKVTIKPLDARATRVEITVGYHGVYRPADAAGQVMALPSGRVDIGCFALSEPYPSAPSIISFYYLPNEERVYRDDGQIQSVDYANEAHRYADPALTWQKGWKDLYTYDAQGHLTGWYRKRGSQTERFTAAGYRVLATDAQDRPIKACEVQYLPRQTGGEGLPPALSYVDTPQQFVYAYADGKDQVGKATPVK